MVIDTFEKIASDTWSRLYKSIIYNVSQGEETITDNILLELTEVISSNVKIIKTPKDKEALKGTDWEWWIGSVKLGWFRYAIQAKKLDLKSHNYSALAHKVGKKPNLEEQHKVLERYATLNDAMPFYVLYNYIKLKNYSTYWNCPLDVDENQLGITITPLHNIKYALKNRGCRSFKHLHTRQDTVPIRCLFRCPEITSAYQHGKNPIIPKFNIRARKYESSEISFLLNNDDNKVDKFPSNLYNPEISIYPKKIALIFIE